MNDELLKALQVIKEECVKHELCKNCPMLNSSDECGVNADDPSEWSLEKREVYF